MANEHDVLVEQYQKYKDEVAEYEKKMYAYTTQIEKCAADVINQIKELKALGVNLDIIKKYAGEDGSIDLTDSTVVRGMIDDVYSLYKETVSEGLALLENR